MVALTFFWASAPLSCGQHVLADPNLFQASQDHHRPCAIFTCIQQMLLGLLHCCKTPRPPPSQLLSLICECDHLQGSHSSHFASGESGV